MSKPATKATTTMKKTTSGATEAKGGDSPSRLIDARIKELGDWRGETLARVRTLIKQADPEVVESALPEAGHLACPVDQRGQGAELRAIMRLATLMAVAHQPGLPQDPKML